VDVFASYKRHVTHTDLLLSLPFNSAEKTNWYPSGTDGSGNRVDFMVQGVNVTKSRPIHALGVAGDGRCYYKLFAPASGDIVDTNACNKACSNGNVKTCGSSTNDQVASVYGKGPIGVGGLSPLIEYAISVEFVDKDGGDYEITRLVVAKTSNATVPGKMEDMNIVERSDHLLEIQWSPVEDDGGSEILRYVVFLDTIQVAETADGTTLSVTVSIPDMQRSYQVAVQAFNAIGAGPRSNSLSVVAVYSDPLPEIPQRPTVSSVSGGTVELELDETTILAVEMYASVVVIEQREPYLSAFTQSVYRRHGSLATIYKLCHNTAYIFRVSVISRSGVQSAFSVPISATTGNRGNPSKTPPPSAAIVTGNEDTHAEERG
jgi:hypothetical protein